jgi:hypothetical protein
MNKNNKIQIKENSTSSSAGEYNGPIELGLKKWRKSELFPFINQSTHKTNKKSKGKNVKGNVNRVVGMWEKGIDGSYNIDTHDVHTVKEWFEVTNDTILEDIVPNGLKTTSNYERVINKFKKDIPSSYHKGYDLIAQKIKDFVQNKGYVIKIINSCNTGFRGVRTNKAIILCSPESLPNFATFVYILFHELRHEQQMSEFDLKDTYMGDVEDFEEFFKIYWKMELDADRYGKEWVKKIGDVLKLPHIIYNLDPMIENYPSMSNMVKQFTLHLHREIQTLKRQGMDYSDISDLDIVKKHLQTLEDMF